MMVMEGIQAPPQVRQIPGQAHSFEIGIEGPLGDGVISEGLQNLFREGFSLGQINDVHWAPIHCIAKKEDCKIRGLGVFIDPALGQVHIAVGLNIDTNGFHTFHLEKSGEAQGPAATIYQFLFPKGFHLFAMIFCFPFFPIPGRNFIPLVLFDIRIDHGYEKSSNAQGNQAVQTIQNQLQNIFHYGTSLVQKIVIVCRSKVVFCSGFSAQRFPVTNLLQVVQAAGNAFVAVGIKGVEVDGGSSIDPAVHFRPFQDLLAGRIYDAGLCGRIGIDEIAVLVGVIPWTFQISVTERVLDGFQLRHDAAVSFELALSFLIGSLDSRFHFFHGLRIRLGDDEAHAVLGGSSVDGFGFPDVGVGPAGICSGNDFARVYIMFHCSFLLNFHC
jgi:hypothetical protein